MVDQRYSDAANFIMALLGGLECSRAAANAHIERARRLDVDLFDVIAAHHKINPDTLYRRAAQIVGLRYCHDLRPFVRPFPDPRRLGDLAQLRTVRGWIGARAVVFIAPSLDRLLALAQEIDAGRIDPDTIWMTAPRTLRECVSEVNAEHMMDNAVHALGRWFPQGAAHLVLSRRLRIGFVVALWLLVGFAFLKPFPFQPAILALITMILIIPSVFRLWAAATAERNLPLSADRLLNYEDLPIYSVLIPLRDEAHMIPQIANAMRGLDYPPEKLDIKFVVESTSDTTVSAVRQELWDGRFSLVVVPQCAPLTKPKATNFALPLVRGRHVVIYDAEDIPDRLQLRHAASLLAQNHTLACLQAELVIANGKKSRIARLFAAEYAGHFGVILPAITRARFPMPLGGTSNHFRTDILRSVGAWDPFNVTEDADLGIRLARLGHRCVSFQSHTTEEAPETVHAWIRQRTRWMKGWMQTLIVHTRHPGVLVKELGWRSFLAFEIFVGSMVLSIALHGLFLVSSAAALVRDVVLYGAPNPWLAFNIATLLLGYAGAIAVSVIGLDRIGRPEFKMVLFALPLYWILACYAVIRAGFDLIARPFYWSKTAHKGLDTSIDGQQNSHAIVKTGCAEASRRENKLVRQALDAF